MIARQLGGKPDIAARRHLQQALFGVVGQVEPANKLAQGALGDSLAPGKRRFLSEFGMKAVLGGTIASLLSATMAGMILG